MKNIFDVIVVGGGHAGIEAAYAAAKLGSKTALVTMSLDKIGLMPCNPSIGGVGKGHIVFEISALGGLMPQLCSKTYLQARMLNTSKGLAVQGLRLQIDKVSYSKEARKAIEKTNNLALIEGKVETILLDNDRRVTGILLADGTTVHAQAVVITTGTFLNGLMHVGHATNVGGRVGEQAAHTLSDFFRKAGLRLGRLKTGTPPRILRTSIDFSKLEEQDAHALSYLFEFDPITVEHKLPCYIARTNKQTHETILANAHQSPIYSGKIQGKPPRYCPSIEDKIKRFSDKESHHVFVEPEDSSYHEVYPSGLSTAMPKEVQEQFIRSMVGFENAIITKPGYAVEYDFIKPDQLHHTLEVKTIPGLFLAGQINGTTGYEEAAGQGIIAGINAHQKGARKKPFILTREESYIGLMIDDLVTLGVTEPYRMFTSRAERRIVLRQDNVFLRLASKAYVLGMLDEEIYHKIDQENNIITTLLAELKSQKTPGGWIKEFGQNEFSSTQVKSCLTPIAEAIGITPQQISERAVAVIYAEIKYDEYLKREQKEIEKAQKFRELAIPTEMDFTNMPGISKEIQEKLCQHKPATIAQAALIQGMTPAAISILIFKCRQMEKYTL